MKVHPTPLISRRGGIMVAMLVSVLASFFTGTADAQTPAQQRFALVIGNGNYKSAPLANPINDARLMDATLRALGFEVTKAENASRREMQRLIRDFGEKLKHANAIGLFYFAGHGMQVKGLNYLLPVDADVQTEDEVAYDSIDAQSILEKMESARNKVNILILDACRDNPFAKNSRSIQSGLATMNAPSGTLVAYATAPGAVASDGAGGNGLYTEHLARSMRQPGLPLEDMFKQVRIAVRRASNNAQTPWENTALEGSFYFMPPQPARMAGESPLQLAQQASQVQYELAFWDSVKNSSSVAEFRQYLERFPNGVFSGLATMRIDTLLRQQQPSATPPPSTSPATTPQNRNGSLLTIRDTLTNLENVIEIRSLPSPNGGQRWSTGDATDRNGQTLSVRMGSHVIQAQKDPLWSHPLTAHTSGSAQVKFDNVSAPTYAKWRVLSSTPNETVLEVQLEYTPDEFAGNLGNRRIFKWVATYRNNEALPIKSTMEQASRYLTVTSIGPAP